MATSQVSRHDGEGHIAEMPAAEAALDASARRSTLRAIAPGTVGTRVVIRECGNVSPRGGRTAPGR